MIKKILHPPMWLLPIIFILSVLFISGSIFTIVINNDIIGYFIYPLAFIFLIYFVYLMIVYFKVVKEEIIKKLRQYEITNVIMNDYGFRTVIISIITLVINMCFMIFNLVLGILIKSSFYIIMAVYYIFLSAVKYGVYMGNKKSKKKKTEKEKLFIKNKAYANTGIKLILMELVFSASIIEIIIGGKKIFYGDIIAIAFAAFTFSKLGLAIYNIFKAKRMNDPITQAFRNISLTDALATLMSMQVTLIAVYSSDSLNSVSYLNIITGVLVILFGIGLGIMMITSGRREIKNERKFDYGER